MMRRLSGKIRAEEAEDEEDAICQQRASVMKNLRGQMENMIRERNDALMESEKRRECELEALEEAQAELDEVRLLHKQERAHHLMEMQQKERELQVLKDEMAGLQDDLLIDTNGFLELVMEGCPDDLHGNAYVKRLQSRLAQALKQMAIMDNQLSLAKSTSAKLIKDLKEDMQHAADERCEVEVDFMNQLATLSTEKRIAEEQLKAQIQLRNEEIERVETNLVALQSQHLNNKYHDAALQNNNTDNADADGESNAALKVQLNNLMHKLSILPDHYLKRIADRDRKIAQLRERCYQKDKALKKLQLYDATSIGLDDDQEHQEQEEEFELDELMNLPNTNNNNNVTKRRSFAFNDSDTSLWDSSFSESAQFSVPDEADIKAMISTVKYATRNMENRVQASLKDKQEMLCDLDKQR